MVKFLLEPSLTIIVPEGVMVPFGPAEAVIVCVFIANSAVTVMSSVTLISIRGLSVSPSLQASKWYPS